MYKDTRAIVKHCIIHTLASSAPGFLLAIQIGINNSSQILGMLAGILIFLAIAITLHLRFQSFFQNKANQLVKCIHLAKQIRFFHALILTLWLPLAPPFTSIPIDTNPILEQFGLWLTFLDIYAGVYANYLTHLISSPVNAMTIFINTAVTTVVDGVLLSLCVITLALTCWLAACAANALRRGKA